MNTALIILAIFLLTVTLIIGLYNKMVKNKNLMLDAWSGIDVFLKKRYDLLPNLVEVVKGYVAHEKRTLEEIIQFRAAAIQAKSPQDKIESEVKLEKALVNLFAVSENYPDLKANENFQQLQSQLADLENDLEKSRRYYNGTARENNTMIEQFPGNMFAAIFDFQKGEFFNIEAEDASKQNSNIFSI